MFQSCSLAGCIGENGLHSIDLCLILVETALNRIKRQRLDNPFSRIDSRIGDIGKGCDTHDFQCGKTNPDRIHCPIQCAKASGRSVHVKLTLEIFNRGHGLRNATLKLSIIEAHR